MKAIIVSLSIGLFSLSSFGQEIKQLDGQCNIAYFHEKGIFMSEASEDLSFSKELRAYKERHGITWRDVAEEVGV